MGGGRIFISYRRTDSSGHAGRLYDRLSEHFGARVFHDVNSIGTGVKWDEAIARHLSQSDACVVVIGTDWLSVLDERGNPRLANPADPLRQEIEVALQREMRVFPVLVDGASMPAENDLPPELRPLCRWNAAELTDRHWKEDVQALIRSLEKPAARSPEQRAIRTPPSNRTWLLAVCGILGAGIVAAVYFASKRPDGGENRDSNATAGFQFAGNWRAVVMTPGRRVDEELDAYRDHSFRLVSSNATAAIGKWQYTPAADLLEVSDATDLTNNVAYSCTWKNVAAAPEQLSGACTDRMQNAWQVSLSRAPGHSFERLYDVPGVNLSSLTTAEKAAFNETLDRQQCGCGMKLLFCLHKHTACPYNKALSQTALAAFLRKVRPFG